MSILNRCCLDCEYFLVTWNHDESNEWFHDRKEAEEVAWELAMKTAEQDADQIRVSRTRGGTVTMFEVYDSEKDTWVHNCYVKEDGEWRTLLN